MSNTLRPDKIRRDAFLLATSGDHASMVTASRSERMRLVVFGKRDPIADVLRRVTLRPIQYQDVALPI
ncbi:MAG TPA: hypothetical protein VN753_04130 [Terracidiphilus sp.]|nr:hypothetical protein [Terracidiphilus sp.]